MKIFIKKIYLLIFILPLLGAVAYKDDQTGGCTGLPNFTKGPEDDGKVTLIASSVNKIEKKSEIIVLGEVKNTTDKLISEVKVLATLKDKDGNTIDSKTTLINGESRRLKSSPDTIDHSVLLPDEKGSFKITTKKPEKEVATVETTVTYSKKKLVKLKGKMEATIKKVKRDNDKLTIRGDLKNNSKNIPTWNNKIAITVKDKAGIIVFVGEKNLGDTLIIDGKQKGFAINPQDMKSFLFQTSVDFDKVGKITKNINWEEEAPSPPVAPSELKASIASSTEISLTFKDNSDDEDGFHLYRKTEGGKFKKIKTIDAVSEKDDTVTTSDTDVSQDSTYIYKVRAFNEVGDSDFSNKAKISISAPASPANLKAIVKSATEIDLAWDDKSNTEIGFSILRNNAEIATVAAGTKTFTDKNLSQGTNYSYEVKAFNNIGSSFGNVTIITLDKPNSPANLTVESKSSTYNKLSWTAEDINNEAGFKVERNANDSGFLEIATIGMDITTYDDKLVSPDTTYKYRVRAYNAIDNSDYSNEAP